MNDYSQVAKLLKALGHPVRLQILAVLKQDEACVCHLESVLGMRQAYISQHLMRLREAGLVIDRREGMNVYYALSGVAVTRILSSIEENVAFVSQAKGEPLHFPPPQDTDAVCPCPKCQAKVAEAHLAYSP